MNGNNNYPGGYAQGAYTPPAAAPAKGQRQKKEKTNVVELTGIVESRGRNQEIQFYGFQNGTGGGVIHINLRVQEFTGKSDENGNPKTTTSFVPVSVYTNNGSTTRITEQQLRSVVAGMKVHVVGRLVNRRFKDNTGADRSTLEVNAYVFEVLEMPMVAPAVPMGGQPWPQQGQQQSYYGGGQPMPQQGPGYVQPQAPTYGGGYPGAPAPGQAQPYPRQQQAPGYNQGYSQGQQQPPYYGPGAPQQGQGGQQGAGPVYNPNDLPPLNVGDINI